MGIPLWLLLQGTATAADVNRAAHAPNIIEVRNIMNDAWGTRASKVILAWSLRLKVVNQRKCLKVLGQMLDWGFQSNGPPDEYI